MSETRFTPGPWNATRPVDYGVNVVAEGIAVAWAEKEADANLIAAAPDMYAALQHVLYTRVFCPSREEKIARLLAKARGEAPP